MPPIHVDTEQLYQTSRTIWQNHLDMIDQIYLLRTSLYHLEMAWQGDTATEFDAEMERLLRNLNSHTEELQSLGLTLSHQGEKWDESDQRWTWNFSNMTR